MLSHCAIALLSTWHKNVSLVYTLTIMVVLVPGSCLNQSLCLFIYCKLFLKTYFTKRKHATTFMAT